MNEPRFYTDEEGRRNITMAESERPEDMICDFCSSKERPLKTYPCPDFTTTYEGEQVVNSLGEWLACPPCARLIDANESEQLIYRAATKAPKDVGNSVSRLKAIRAIHSQFFKHKQP